MRTVLEPRLIDPTAFEPGLVVGVRDHKRALLFDIGPQIRALPPRVLLRATHVFVTHTHMDHFAGFDHLLAVGLGRVRRLVLWGGPGFCEQVGHKLAAYTWNVVQRYEVPMTIEAHALLPDGSRQEARFESARGFERTEPFAAAGGNKPSECSKGGAADDRHAAEGVHLLLDEPLLRVSAVFVDHEMPVLAFAIEERRRCASPPAGSPHSGLQRARGCARSRPRCWLAHPTTRRSTSPGATDTESTPSAGRSAS